MHRQRQKRKIVIFVLIGLLFVMGIGYSAFSSNLKISGNTKITSNWDVEITGVSAPTLNGSAEEVNVPTYDKLSASMNVNLYEPGDSVEYDVTISNLGTIDATLDNYTLGTSTSSMIVTFSNFTKGEIIYKKGHSNSTKNIHVKIEYNPEYSGGEVSEETSITFNFKEPEVKEVTNDEVISKDKYLVTYDCTTNGGTSCEEFNEYLLPNSSVNLNKTPSIEGYRFIGWNTDASASTGLSSYTMPSNNTTLYAVLEALDQTPPVIDSVSTTKTSSKITVIATAHDDETGISKYEFSKDDGSTWTDNGTSGTYTFTNLTMGQTYPIKVRVTNGANGKTTSESYSVTPNLQAPTFTENQNDITITYPEGCGSTYTCTYKKNNGSPVTVTQSATVVSFDDDGELVAYVSEGNNSISSSYTVVAKKYTITYDYNNDVQVAFAKTEYADTGYLIDWDKDFTIEGVFKYPTAAKNYLVIGNYSDNDKTLSIELNSSNKFRIYMGSGNIDVQSDVVGRNTNINYTYTWDASENTYTFTATGTSTDINMTGTYNMSGKATKTLRYGNVDYRDDAETTFVTTTYHKDLSITKEYVHGGKLDNPTPVSKPQYTYNGWFTADTDGTEVTNSTNIPASNTTYYAHWTPNTYTVKFNANGGSGTMADEEYTYDVAKALTANAFTRSGYTFIGWTTSSGGTGTAYSNKQSVSNLTKTNEGVYNLYAQWRKSSYSVVYNGNGSTSGSMSNQTINYNADGTLNANAFTKTAYDFTEWNTNSAGTGNSYSDKATVNIRYNMFKGTSAPTLPTNTTSYAMSGRWGKTSTALAPTSITVSDAPSGLITKGFQIPANTTSGRYYLFFNNMIVKNKTSYTVSVYAKGSGNLIIRAGNGTPYREQSFALTNSWQRYEMRVYTVTSSTTGTYNARSSNYRTNIYFGTDAGNGAVQIAGAKMETGTTASEYIDSTDKLNLYASYEISDTTPPVIDNVSTTKTSSTITVIATAHDDESDITKYEFSSDNGSTWTDNGANGTYTFTNLTMGQTYPIKVRVTNGAEMKTTSEKVDTTTKELEIPTFIENVSGSNTNVEITYPIECSNGTYTCTYKKNSDSAVTVNSSNLTDNKISVEFTDSGTLVATISDGTNTTSSSYTVSMTPVSESGTENYDTTGTYTFTAPATGDYYLQVWGAQGGGKQNNSSLDTANGGLGGYSYGTVTLNKGDILYINTGGMGSSIDSGKAEGGFNGGGSAWGTGTSEPGNGGGGASDIRINSDSLYARVIVAGGGGGGGEDSGDTPGYGGGTSGGSSSGMSTLATQTSTGTGGSFGQGAHTANDGGGGGGGWYGGGTSGGRNTPYTANSSSDTSGGAGGSGYVYTTSTASNYPSGCLLTSDYYLKDAATVAGNTSFASPSGGTETGHSGNGYVKITYDINTIANDKATLAVSDTTTNSSTVTATPKTGLSVTKYEFSKDNGSTWINNGTNGTYTFTGLTHNTTYNLKVRITTSEGKVVNTIEAKTKELLAPTFNDANGENSVNSTITYTSGCGSAYTCTYKKNNDSAVTVNSSTETVNFTSAGTLTATISDGTNTVTDTHNVTEAVTLSFTTSKTTNSITVTDTVSAPTGVSKYEYQIDGGSWVQGTNNVYTFTNLSNTSSHTVNSRITTNFGTVKTGTSSTVTLNPITLPTYKVEYTAIDDGDVTITYPSGCGSTYTCTYIKNSESPVTVTSTTAVVNYSADGELAASISDGTNTVSNSFTVTMPLDVIDDYGVNMLVVGGGDGVYQDDVTTDDTAYFYRGANPNNYIDLGGDIYRIMSIDTSGNLKVIKDTPLSRMIAWDLGYSSNISGITSSSSTAGTRYSSTSTDYCYTSSASSYYGCKSWGSKTSTLNSSGTSAVTQMPLQAGSSTLYNLPTYDSYVNVYLNGGTYPTSSGTTTLTSWYSTNVDSSIQSKMIDHLWNVGPVAKDSGKTLAQNIGQEAAYKWSGKVGLMTATDYVRASTNSACSNVYSYNSNSTCYNNSSTHNWLYKNAYQWTMAPSSILNRSYVWFAYSLDLYDSSAYNSYFVHPVLYLSSDIRLKGKGTADSPYYVYTEPTSAAKATLTKLGQTAKEYGTTDGDGIYEDNEGGYYYRGANPSNYINLGSDLYRIMSIDTSGNLKVIKDTPIYMEWDPGYSSNISGITSSSSTAGTRYSSTSTDYCYNSSASSYYGCKSWGSKTSTLNSAGTSAVTQMPWEAGSTTLKNLPEYDSYINVYLNGGTYGGNGQTANITSWYSTNVASNLQSKLVSHLWNIGPVSSNSSLTLAQNIRQEAAYKWSGKVGLMTATDYVRASTNLACTNVSKYQTNSSCYNNSSTHNWLYKSSNQWTMAPNSNSNANNGWSVNSAILSGNNAYSSYGVRPVLYLSSDISITGAGTSGSPFGVADGGSTGTQNLSDVINVTAVDYMGETRISISPGVDVPLEIKWYTNTNGSHDPSEFTLKTTTTANANTTYSYLECQAGYAFYVVVSDPSGTYSGTVTSNIAHAEMGPC